MNEKPKFITSEWKVIEATSHQAGVTEYMDVPGGWVMHTTLNEGNTSNMCFVPYPLGMEFPLL